jgi:glycosyltransferase involved in cell wall biosynthesis
LLVKIGVVTHYMPPHIGGIERVAETLFAQYRRHRLDVRWVASRVPKAASDVEEGRVRVPCWNGLETFGVPVPFWGERAWRKVTDLVAWADVLHVHDCLYPGSAMATAHAHHAGKPVLLTQHIGYTRYRVPAWNWIEALVYATVGRWVLRHASHIVLATPRAAKFVPTLLRATPQNCSEIPNGVDTRRFRPPSPAERVAARQWLGVPSGPAVLFAGRLSPNKRLDVIVDVARQLPEVCFLVVGTGPMAPLLATRPPNILWHSSVEHERMPDCYHAADCLLLPSKDEGLPLVVQEAFASGLPVVVRAGELFSAPLVRAGLCLTAPADAAAMACCVREALSRRDPSHAARAREYATAHWSVEAMGGHYVALLREISERASAVARSGTR